MLGATNTMLASIGARTREVGILRAIGFREVSILLAFLVEAALIGLVGGLLGCLIVLPLNGLETGTMNWNSFTDTSFAFRVDAPLLGTAVLIAMFLARRFKLDDARKTPAVARDDGVDFVPTRPFYLLGQHFSAIAAAGPIVGPIAAVSNSVGSRAPVDACGLVFIGAVHDLLDAGGVGAARGKLDRRGRARDTWAARRPGDAWRSSGSRSST